MSQSKIPALSSASKLTICIFSSCLVSFSAYGQVDDTMRQLPPVPAPAPFPVVVPAGGAPNPIPPGQMPIGPIPMPMPAVKPIEIAPMPKPAIPRDYCMFVLEAPEFFPDEEITACFLFLSQ